MIRQLALLLICLPSVVLGQDSSRFRELARSVETRRVRDSVPALSIAVAKDGRIVWAQAFGVANRERSVAATVDTPFPLGSVSKPLTATALMTLVQSQRIDLDRAANDYLGDGRITTHVGSPNAVTLRTLASHSSGISRHDLFAYETDATTPMPIDERIRRYAHTVRPVGSYEYSNLNYMILARVVERVSGEPFAEYMRQRVFLPLGMRSASIGAPRGGQGLAVSYSATRTPVRIVEGAMAGAGGAYATAEDLARFGLFHLGHASASGAAPLSADMLRAMRTPTAQTRPGEWYGLGWRIDSTSFAHVAILHTGSNGASASVVILVPALDLCVVALANSLTDLPGTIAAEIVRSYTPGRTAPVVANDSTGPFATRPFRATSDVTGTWTGTLAAYDGDVPVRFTVDDTSAVWLQLRDGPVSRASGVRWEGRFLRGSFDGELGTSDTRGHRYRLHFKLQRSGDQLLGAITAVSAPSEPVFTLSHFVRLTRR